MFVSPDEITRWKADVDANDDIGPDERLRAKADIAILNVVSLIFGVLGFFVGIGIAGMVMVWLLPFIESKALAMVSAWLAVALSMSLPVSALQVGRRLQRRRLQRALRIATQRRHSLIGNVGAGGASVAVSASSVRSR